MKLFSYENMTYENIMLLNDAAFQSHDFAMNFR